jgi:hypothetical protein
MTVLSRGARVRRGGRRPGWLLLTTLLVLAIAASSALVFTNRVELLKLAVILALWAAIGAAFVSVIYRRQSDWDQARVRDLKLVYDLQLDREISARREYELTVESQLRRELASELSAQAADEVAALRAELAALRTNLEILFDAELTQRPALEFDRATVRSYSDWDRESESLRDRVSRVTAVRAEEASRADDTSIIDVPEEPLVPPSRPEGYFQQAPDSPFRGAAAYESAQAQAGAQWQHDDRRVAQHEHLSRAQWAPPGHHEPWAQQHARPAERQSEPQPAAPSQYQRSSWAKPDERPRHQPLWVPPGVAASDSVSKATDNYAAAGDRATLGSEPKLAAPPPAERPGRHSVPAEPVGEAVRRAEARHSAGESSPPESAIAPPAPPAARHRSADSSADPHAQHTGGQSVAELLARLQASPTGGGRRRRHAQ